MSWSPPGHGHGHGDGHGSEADVDADTDTDANVNANAKAHTKRSPFAKLFMKIYDYNICVAVRLLPPATLAISHLLCVALSFYLFNWTFCCEFAVKRGIRIMIITSEYYTYLRVDIYMCIYVCVYVCMYWQHACLHLY